MITTRWFSASPSNPPSREAPCPPKDNSRWLQVPLGCLPLSRSCPFRVLHTCLALRPVRHYPHFWISTWSLRLSGTSTHLTHVLPGTHCGPLRHPFRPGLLLTEVQLVGASYHRWGFPCTGRFPCACMPTPLPRWDWRDGVARLVSPAAAFPVIQAGQLPHCPFRGLLSVHSCSGLHAR